jgi:hypothetical protein
MSTAIQSKEKALVFVSYAREDGVAGRTTQRLH